MEIEKVFVYTYRYMWKVDSSENVNFKIVSDTQEGVDAFEKALLSVDGLVSCAKEYLHQYDVSRVGVFEKVFELGSPVSSRDYNGGKD